MWRLNIKRLRFYWINMNCTLKVKMWREYFYIKALLKGTNYLQKCFDDIFILCTAWLSSIYECSTALCTAFTGKQLYFCRSKINEFAFLINFLFLFRPTWKSTHVLSSKHGSCKCKPVDQIKLNVPYQKIVQLRYRPFVCLKLI